MIEDVRGIIMTATLELLKKKDYKDVQMKEIAETANIGRRTLYRYFGNKDEIMGSIVESLMEDLAEVINQNGRMDLEGIAYSYFVFWARNLEELRLLKKAHLMYLLEDNMPELMIGVSLKTKYKGKTIDEVRAIRNSFSEEANYNYNYMLAGYMRVAEVWMENENRRPPEEMAKIIVGIVNRDFPGIWWSEKYD